MKSEPLARQRRSQILSPALKEIAHHSVNAFPRRLKNLCGRPPVEAALHNFAFNLLLEARDADFEKLIEIRIRDAKKLHPLQQRIARVQRLSQHPLVKLQPAQFPVYIV